jgi:hypothetical protein
MKGENFSLYKNIKHLCRNIYYSIKQNNSEQINSYINIFNEFNSELKNRINIQNGGYNAQIEQLKNNIINKIIKIKQMKGGLNDDNIKLKTQILEKIKFISIKDFKEQFEEIEKSLNKIKIFFEAYQSLQKTLISKNKIIKTKYENEDAFRALMGTINPTEIQLLQNQLEEFTKNIRTIVDDSASPPENLDQTIRQTCRSYIPQQISSPSITVP